MELDGQNRVNASPERVWAALNDPAVLERCVPGLSGVTRDGDVLTAAMELTFGSARGTYRGQIRVLEERAPEYARLAAEGRSPVGMLRGEATVRLERSGEGTLVRWQGSSRLGGVLAFVGRSVLQGVARSHAEAFFARLDEELRAT
ncbi:CoxG family protein [Deinococcus pimensis]|uniref:CoxG family protein n=1 Tax=Deinococcus pimensis TaxID=309888 RepID=UPI0004815F2B|nr:carbon monoxide dehydrogenase subunit G [Deinococcus pimensis]